MQVKNIMLYIKHKRGETAMFDSGAGEIFKTLAKGIAKGIGEIPIIQDENPKAKICRQKSWETITKTADAMFVRNVTPERGTVVYCDLAVLGEHTGIYMGGGHIIHLNGSGEIERVGSQTFIDRLNGNNNALTIFCPVDSKGQVISFDKIADRAEAVLGSKRNYNILTDNCHRFTYYCLTGNSDFLDSSFTGIETTLKYKYGFDNWRATTLV